MVILKKIKGATLMETLVATVLIIIVFLMSSMILNTIFSSSVKNNTRAIEAHLNELEYLRLNNKLKLPYQETLKDWNVSVEAFLENNQTLIEFEAINLKTNKTIVVKQYEANN